MYFRLNSFDEAACACNEKRNLNLNSFFVKYALVGMNIHGFIELIMKF